MKTLLVQLLLFAAWALSARCQVTSDPKADTSKAIDIIKHYAGFYYVSESSEVGQIYVKFSHSLSVGELVRLTDYWNPATRCYAFFALSEKRSSLIDSILQAHLQDTAHVFIIFGDVGDHQTIGDFFYNVVTGHLFGGIDLNSPVEWWADSLLNFRPGILLKGKNYLIKTFPFKESWIPRLREIATIEKNNNAVVTLSKYRDPQDLPLIENLLTDPSPKIQYLGLLAARNWPDPALFPYIKKIHEAQIGKTAVFNFWQIRVLYQAIVQYRDSASRELLVRVLKKAKGQTFKYHSDNIWIAFTKYPDPIYAGIRPRLKIKSDRKEYLRYQININED